MSRILGNYYIDEEGMETKIENIAVIREYPNVFPKDLQGLPSDREVEFSIDLLSGTSPMLRALIECHPQR